MKFVVSGRFINDDDESYLESLPEVERGTEFEFHIGQLPNNSFMQGNVVGAPETLLDAFQPPKFSCFLGGWLKGHFCPKIQYLFENPGAPTNRSAK